MYKRTFIILIIWVLAIHAFPQQPLSTLVVDQQTYSLYRSQNWDELIALGKTALGKDIDFFYLRYRMGIAWYYKGNYHQAIRHLSEAYRQNQQDEYLKEYLYYAFLITNRKQEAGMVAESMSPSTIKRLGIEAAKFVDHADVAFNINIADNDDITQSFIFPDQSVSDGNQYISGGHSYFNLSLSHTLSSRSTLYHGYTRIDKDYFVYSRTGSVPTLTPESGSQLNQYYLSVNTLLSQGMNLIAGLHYINIGYNVNIAGQGQGQGPGSGFTSRASVNDYLGFLSLYQHMPYVTAGATAYLAGLNNTNKVQADATIAFYPLGNLNLYGVSTISFSIEDLAEQQRTNRIVFYQRLGGQVAPFLWLEAYAGGGNMQNLLRHDGLIVYNTLDKLTAEYGARAIAVLGKVSISLGYTLINHESSFKSTTASFQNYNTLKYNSHSITGGLTWNF